MIERMKKKAAALLIACLFAILMPVGMLTSYAANARIAFSDPSATVGSQVSVNMEITATGGNLMSADVMLSYDSNLLEFVSGTDASGDAGAIRVRGDGGTPGTDTMRFSLTFNAIAAGTAKITVSSQEIYDTDSQLVTVDREGSSTITVGALADASDDATLKSLQVSPGTLSPSFSPDVDTYSVTVGTDVDKIIVSAVCNDENATNIVSGNEGLQMGENRVTCQVTAQDGETTKEYVIVVTKAEGGASTATPILTGNEVKLSAPAKTITILEPDESITLPEGFVENPVVIDGQTVTGWVWASDPDNRYCIVYGMNEAGETAFYRYDLDENERTLQRYFEDPAVDTGVSTAEYDQLASQYNNLIGDYRMTQIIAGVVGVIAVLLLILLIWQLMKHKEEKNDSKQPPLGRSRRKEEASRERGEEELPRAERGPRGAGKPRRLGADQAVRETAPTAEPEPMEDSLEVLDLDAEEPESHPASTEEEKPQRRPARTSGKRPEPEAPQKEKDEQEDEELEIFDL